MAAEVLTDLALDLPDRRDGKVRISWALPDDAGGPRRLFVTTDRLSAFDRVLAVVPDKGRVLNQLSAWWFAHTGDIVANHLLALPDPNVTVARSATPLPVEVVVRGYITGVTDTSIWGMYAAGARTVYGQTLPEGLHKNDRLERPIITPTTKAAHGGHDEPVALHEVVRRGLVPPQVWDDTVDRARALYERGRAEGERAGLVLADTKYEFGLAVDGTLMVIDELHTPDSSRWWIADSLAERRASGAEPDSLDKEVVRRAFAEAGFRGDGTPPALPDSLWHDVAGRYRRVYQVLTGRSLEPLDQPIAERITARLAQEHLL